MSRASSKDTPPAPRVAASTLVPWVAAVALLLLARAAWRTGDIRAAVVSALQVAFVAAIARFALRRAETILAKAERRWRGSGRSGSRPGRTPSA